MKYAIKFGYIFFSFLLFIICNLEANAKKIYVDGSATGINNGSSWINAFKYLNNALIVANSSTEVDSIFVAEGIYYPTGIQNANNRDSCFGIFNSGIKIYGGYAAGGGPRFSGEATVLSGNIGDIQDSTDNSYHVVALVGIYQNLDSVLLDGLTITAGKSANFLPISKHAINGLETSRSYGGGIISKNNTSLNPHLIRNCIVEKNVAYKGGGYCSDTSETPLYIVNCRISENESAWASAVYSDCLHTNMYTCSIINNRTILPGILGSPSQQVVYLNGSATLQTCIFQNNIVYGKEILSILNPSENESFISDCLFINNKSRGVLFHFFSPQTPLVLKNSIFYQNVDTFNNLPNTSNVSSLISAFGEMNFYNNVIARNALLVPANYGAPIIYVDDTSGKSIIGSNMFFGNKTGGPIFWNVSPNSQLAIHNSIFWDKDSLGSNSYFQVDPTSTLTLSHSITKNPYPGTNNSTTYPLFYDTLNLIGPDGIWRTADDGLNLLYCSQAINSGDNSLVPAGLTTSITGSPRIAQGTVDRGAYESTATGPQTPALSISSNTTFPACAGNAVSFTAQPFLPGSAPFYQWTVNNLNVGSNSPNLTYIPANGDVVECTMTSNSPCLSTNSAPSNSITVAVTQPVTTGVVVDALPAGPVSNGQTVLFTTTSSNSGPNPSVNWYKNQQPIPGANNAIYSGTAGTHFVHGDQISARLISYRPCVTQDTVWSNSLMMQVTTSVKDVSSKQLLLHPNPTTGIVLLPEMRQGDELKIFNSLGQELTIPISTPTQTADLSALPAGNYLLQLWRKDALLGQGRVSKW